MSLESGQQVLTEMGWHFKSVLQTNPNWEISKYVHDQNKIAHLLHQKAVPVKFGKDMFKSFWKKW